MDDSKAVSTAVSTVNLTKKFKSFIAVDHVSINVPKGSIYGLIGKNGAGKTTIMKIISGMLQPTEGNFQILGAKNGNCRKVGTLIESPGIFANMSGFENLKMKCILMGIKDEDYIKKLLDMVGLENNKRKAKNYSLGMRQRLGIALALIGEPKVLVLDEPINGLDPQGIVEVRNTIQKLNQEKGMTIIISSHILEELSRIADVYGVIHYGRILEEISREDFEKSASDSLLFVSDTPEKVVSFMKEHQIEEDFIDKGENHYEIRNYLSAHNEIIAQLVKADISVKDIDVKRESLENYYLKLTGGVE